MSTDRRQLGITYAGAPGQQRAMYDERMVAPMRRELTEIGFEELRTADEVDTALRGQSGTALVLVNSVCGCSARMARPAARIAVEGGVRPDRLYTVFAGQDADATERARGYFTGYPPSSPSFAILRDGDLVWMMERRQIEGRPAPEIALELIAAFEAHQKDAG
ncbi:MAG TPA: BrxA/BrxB family bacilliredoxin [Gemmatimonadaceae bacterium]